MVEVELLLLMTANVLVVAVLIRFRVMVPALVVNLGILNMFTGLPYMMAPELMTPLRKSPRDLGLTLRFTPLVGTVLVVMILGVIGALLVGKLVPMMMLAGSMSLMLPPLVALTQFPIPLSRLLLSREALILQFPVPRKANITLLLTIRWPVPLSRPLTMLSPLEIPELLSIMANGCLGPLAVPDRVPILPLISRFVVVGRLVVMLQPEFRVWRIMLKLLEMKVLLRVVTPPVQVVCLLVLPEALLGPK